jgi:NAD(P)-dependent dehydrogenase (short-subunit alcohol dehydrogenase family)
MTQRSLERPGGDTIAATGNYACSAARRRLSRVARSRLSSRDGEHRKIRKKIWLTCSYLNLLVSDIVFANTGIAKYAPFGGITKELCDSIFNVNMKGLLLTGQKVLPLVPDGVTFAMLKIQYRSCKNTVSFLYPLPHGNDSLRILKREFLIGEMSDLIHQC